MLRHLPWGLCLLLLVGSPAAAEPPDASTPFALRQALSFTDGAGAILTLSLHGGGSVAEISATRTGKRTYRCRALGADRFRCPSATGLALVSACVSLKVATGRCDAATLQESHGVEPGDPAVANAIEAALAKVAGFDAKTLETWKKTLTLGSWSDGIVLELPPDPASLVRVRSFSVEAPDLVPRDVVGKHTAVFTPERVGTAALPRAGDPVVAGLPAPGPAGTPVPPASALVDLTRPAVAECHAIASVSGEIRGTVLLELTRTTSGQLRAENVERATIVDRRFLDCLRLRLGVKRREDAPGPSERGWLFLRVDPPTP